MPQPPERSETLRAELRAALHSELGPQTIRELSQALGASERDLLTHLEHLARSLPHDHERLIVEPARCLSCSFEFEDRTRYKKPGRCPACKSTRITAPRFAITK
ncbi:MAG TPA: transcriptional regulator [Polyangiales bacterium]|nr:transcriptional regulator [Polyangiales bacterium]